MYVECFTNNGKPYLCLVQSVRVTNKAGKKIPQKQVVFNIGPLDRFDDGQPGYVERLKNSFRDGSPLIQALKPYCHTEKSPEDYRFSIKEGSPDCFGHPRLLNPASKSATVRQNEDYYEPVLGTHNPDNVFDTLDHLTLRKSLEGSIDGMDFSRFILIADRGICNYPNLLHVSDAGNGYIVSKSLLKSTKKEQEWTYSDDGYISVSEDFKYKSRIVKKTVKDENGDKRTIEEKVVVYWSRKFQAREEQENKKFLDFLGKLQEHPENFRITAVQSKSLRKFFKKDCVNEKTGEILDSSKIRAFVDFDKVAEYRKSLGYYQIVTSELTMDAQEVIDRYHGLTQIEDQFRVMKSDLETRPLYVSTPQHVTAHLLICMIALVMMRVIQKRIRDNGGVAMDPDAYWSSGLNAQRLQTALNKWKVDLLPGDLYRFMDADDPDLKLILDAFGISLPPKLYRRAELKHIKTEIKVFM